VEENLKSSSRLIICIILTRKIAKERQFILKLKLLLGENLIENFVHIEDKFLLKVSINAVAEDGKANKAIIKFLAKAWHLSQDQLELMKGHNNNIKLLAIR
jgi:uncharacterized protein YggU (UPF0235/DUF167 family)